MSRQYNMYNVQLSEFWKQRCQKEGMLNAPYLADYDDDVASEAPSRAPSVLSTTSTTTQNKVRASAPTTVPARHIFLPAPPFCVLRLRS